MKVWTRTTCWSAVAAAAVGLVACGGGGSGGGSDATEGTLRVALTDAPACGYDEVNVTVTGVEVHKDTDAAEGDSGWERITLPTPLRVNLLDLTNGVLAELGSTELPAGRYTQIRLILAGNSPAEAMANSIRLTGGGEVALDTPSAQQTGLKMNVNIDVAGNETADVVLDFDACKSVVPRGLSGRYNLKPVVSVLPRVTITGLAVEGYLAGQPASGAAVSLQQNGVVARATVVDSEGRFLLSPVPAGTYDMVISAEGRVTAVMSGVPVTETGMTTVSVNATPITLTASAIRSVSGTVTASGSSVVPDATVRALQAVNGRTVELIGRPVDADTGDYSFTLPVAAPVFATYNASVTAPVFTEDTSAAAQYTLSVAVPERDTQTGVVDLSLVDATVNFSFAP